MKDIQTELHSAVLLLNASLHLSILQGGGGDHLCSVLAYYLVWPRAVRVQTHPEALRLLSVFSPSDAHLPRCYGENTQQVETRDGDHTSLVVLRPTTEMR